MAGKLTHTYTSVYDLTVNPTTVTSTGLLEAGLYGGGGIAWTLVNRGTVEGPGSSGFGISLDQGSVSNLGVISGGGGIDLFSAGGRVTNGSSSLATATISTNQNGVFIEGGAGTVVNYGSISVAGAVPAGDFSQGVILFDGGTVKNLGVIQADGTSGTGINLQDGGSVTNGKKGATAGLVQGYQNGIFASAAATATVTNYGTIQVEGTSGTGVNLEGGGSVNNQGTIESVGATSALYFDVVDLAAGSVTNGSTADRSATIASSNGERDIRIAAAGAAVTNFGTIITTTSNTTGAGASIFLLMGGTVVNYGLIEGAQRPPIATAGVVVLSRGEYATIRNLGTIASIAGNNSPSDGINIDHGGIIINGNASTPDALISGSYVGISAGVLSGVAYGAGAAAQITNYGTIENSSALQPGVGINSGGTVTNRGLITSPEAAVSFRDNPGTVLNFGNIVSTATGTIGAGVALHAGGTVTNEVGGTITAYRSAVSTQTITAAVYNFGSAGNTGNFPTIYIGAGGTVTNGSAKAPGATVTSSLRSSVAFNNDAGTLVNFGTIQSMGPLSGTLGAGVYLQAGGTVTNEKGGLITALRNGISVGGDTVATSAAALVTNFATISGNVGVSVGGLDTGANTIVDHGTITGTGGTAVSFGAGNDTLVVDAGAVFNGQVLGGLGTDTVEFKSVGTAAFAGFSGFETVTLANGGANTLTLADANFAGVTGDKITIKGGSGGNTIDASAVTGTHKAILVGGAGADVLTAGQHETMTGGAGADIFAFTTPGTLAAPDTNAITDFTHSTDKIAFSDAGFSLGLAGASSTPTALPATMFTSDTTGKFTAADQRFAYDTANGKLYYDAQGNTAGSSKELVATLTGHPTLTASDLFFVS